MNKSTINTRRRRVLSRAGTVIISGIWASGLGAADDHGCVYESHVSPENLVPGPSIREPSIQSNASATATICVIDGKAHIEITVDCLRNGCQVRFLRPKIDGRPGEVTEIASFDLEGPVTEGLVHNETILTATINDEGFIEALDTDDSVIVIATEQYPSGELAGLEFEKVDAACPKPDSAT